jgi:hypothetical protein
LPDPKNERQWSFNNFWHCVMKHPAGCVMTLTDNRTLSCLSTAKWLLQQSYYVLKMSFNGHSTTFGLASWKMQGLCSDMTP